MTSIFDRMIELNTRQGNLLRELRDCTFEFNSLKSSVVGKVSTATTIVPVARMPRKATVVESVKRERTPKKTIESHTKHHRNQKPLVSVVLELLNRPNNQEGLTAGQIVSLIEKENLWKSSSDDIGNLVHGALYTLRTKKNFVKKGEQRKYFIPAGVNVEAELNA